MNNDNMVQYLQLILRQMPGRDGEIICAIPGYKQSVRFTPDGLVVADPRLLDACFTWEVSEFRDLSISQVLIQAEKVTLLLHGEVVSEWATWGSFVADMKSVSVLVRMPALVKKLIGTERGRNGRIVRALWSVFADTAGGTAGG